MRGVLVWIIFATAQFLLLSLTSAATTPSHSGPACLQLVQNVSITTAADLSMSSYLFNNFYATSLIVSATLGFLGPLPISSTVAVTNMITPCAGGSSSTSKSTSSIGFTVQCSLASIPIATAHYFATLNVTACMTATDARIFRWTTVTSNVAFGGLVKGISFTGGNSWAGCSTACGGKRVTILTQDKSDVINILQAQYGSDQMWIGLNNVGSKVMRWVDNPSQPQASNGNTCIQAYCMTLSIDDTVNDPARQVLSIRQWADNTASSSYPCICDNAAGSMIWPVSLLSFVKFDAPSITRTASEEATTATSASQTKTFRSPSLEISASTSNSPGIASASTSTTVSAHSESQFPSRTWSATGILTPPLPASLSTTLATSMTSSRSAALMTTSTTAAITNSRDPRIRKTFTKWTPSRSFLTPTFSFTGSFPTVSRIVTVTTRRYAPTSSVTTPMSVTSRISGRSVSLSPSLSATRVSRSVTRTSTTDNNKNLLGSCFTPYQSELSGNRTTLDPFSVAFVSNSSLPLHVSSTTLLNSSNPVGVLVTCSFSYDNIPAMGAGTSVSVNIFIPSGKLNATVVGDGQNLKAASWPSSTQLSYFSASDFWLNMTISGVGGGQRWPPVTGATFELLVPRLSALRCNTTLIIRIITGPRAASTASTAVATTTSIAAVMSVADAGSGMQLSKLTIIQSLTSCSDGTMYDTPIGFSGGSYTGMAIGSTSGLYLRGAVVGNLIIAVAAAGCCVVFAMLWAILLVRFPTLRGRLLSREDQTVSVGKAFARTAELIHFPSVLWSLALLLSPVMLSSAVALLQLPVADSGSVLIALMSLVAVVSYFTYVSYLLKAQFCCILEDSNNGKMANRMSSGTFVGVFVRLWNPRKRWVAIPDIPHATSWKRKNCKIFDPYTISWFSATDGWFAVASGILNGVGGTSNSAALCSAKTGIIAALFVAQAGWAIAATPWPSRISIFYGNGCNVATAVSALLVVAYVLQGNSGQEELIGASNWISVVVGIASILRMLGDFIYIVFKFLRETSSAVVTNSDSSSKPLLIVESGDTTMIHGDDELELFLIDGQPPDVPAREVVEVSSTSKVRDTCASAERATSDSDVCSSLSSSWRPSANNNETAPLQVRIDANDERSLLLDVCLPSSRMERSDSDEPFDL